MSETEACILNCGNFGKNVVEVKDAEIKTMEKDSNASPKNIKELEKRAQKILQEKEANRQKIAKYLKVFFPNNEVVESRIFLKDQGTYFGYFSDMEELARNASEFDCRNDSVAIYVTLNPVNPALLARSNNRIKPFGKKDCTTSDEDTLRREWFLLDIDPERASGISSTDQEHENAINATFEIRDYLTSLGWPEPIVGDSGNGAGLLYSIDLPSKDDTVERVLKALDRKFTDDRIKVDTSVFNPSRIRRLYGTMNRKGDNLVGIKDVEDRPWRQSKLLFTPEKILKVSKEQLEGLIKKINDEMGPIEKEKSAKKGKKSEDKTQEKTNSDEIIPDIEKVKENRAIVERILKSMKEKDDIDASWKDQKGGYAWDLRKCPMSNDHSDGAFIIIRANGIIGAGCQHNSCRGDNRWGWRELRAKYDTKMEENCSPVEEVPEEIKEKAREILEHGDPIQYIADSCGKMVIGAEKAFKKLICCIAVQEVMQSAGLHPKLNGESGTGKTFVVLTFAHHLPSEAIVMGSSSNLAAFYHDNGNQIFRILDDYQAGNETLDTIIKQTSSVFHQKYPHKTTIKQKPVTLYIGSEQTWAITSVDSSQDIQVLNRQIPINVDDSEELTKRVNDRTIERYGKGEEQYPEEETVLICREIWRILRSEGIIDIRIPYYSQINWLDTSNRRNPSIFMDLLVAHTSMFRYQRKKDDGGCYLATEADFEAAKGLFTDRDAEELVKRLTRKEREFAKLLSEHPEGLSRKEAADRLNISETRVSQLANGEKGKGGLCQKLNGFHIEDVSDSVILETGDRRTIWKTIYKLSHYDPLSGFDAVVILKGNNCISANSKDSKQQ